MKKGSKVPRKAYIKPLRKKVTVNLYQKKTVALEDLLLAVESI
jgi:hypothetical protein